MGFLRRSLCTAGVWAHRALGADASLSANLLGYTRQGESGEGRSLALPFPSCNSVNSQKYSSWVPVCGQLRTPIVWEILQVGLSDTSHILRDDLDVAAGVCWDGSAELFSGYLLS